MGPLNELVKEFGRRGHPLGHSIGLDELPVLCESLRKRLGVSDNDLDLSPTSLKRLEKRLIELHQSMQEQGRTFTEEETIQLIREIAAYVGEVLVKHANGKWQITGTLWGTQVVIDEPVEVIKGRERHMHSRTIYSLGNIAASTWGPVTRGVKPNLFQDYLDARAKRVRERL